jgi:hypothetical protein
LHGIAQQVRGVVIPGGLAEAGDRRCADERVGQKTTMIGTLF